MNTVKDEVKHLLDTLPDDCSLEDVQYHLYVIEDSAWGADRRERGDVFAAGSGGAAEEMAYRVA